MKRLGRRSFVKSSATLAAAGGLPFLYERRAFAAGRPPLIPDPKGILDLAQGFSYRILDRVGEPMSDGYRVPGLPDGMGCFPLADGTLALMRNHELQGLTGIGPYLDTDPAPPEAFDPTSHGGVTRLVVDAKTFRRVSSNLVLVGTIRNCAGGKCPWGWLTCEEVVHPTHGYVFLCSPEAERVSPPYKITNYGHMYHEAACFDPRSYAGYITEDRPDGCLYRLLPDDVSKPFEGRFQALGIAGQPGFSTVTGLRQGQALDVCWVDVPDPNPVDDTLRLTAQSLGAAVICRGEGIWYQEGVIYFTATSGGAAGRGQIFALKPTRTGGVLVLVAESTGDEMMNGPDTLGIAPWGDLMVTEDSVTERTENRLLGITPKGEMYVLGRTLGGELSGLCFSPDGRALFVSVFAQGVTLVVTGPFPPPVATEPDPTEPDPDWGMGGAGGAPDVPDNPRPPEPPAPPRRFVQTHPARGCSVAEPGSETRGGALAVAAVLGAATLAAGRRGDRDP